MADLLFVCHRIPYPPNKGEKIRAYRILRYLGAHYRIHLGFFIDDAADSAHLEAAEKLAAEIGAVSINPIWARIRALSGLATGLPLSVAAFANTTMKKWIAATLRRVKPTAVYAYSSAMAQYADGDMFDGIPLLMDFVDVDSDKWRQYSQSARWPLSRLYAREARTLLAFDRAVAARAHAALFVSEPEAALFRRLAPESAARVFAVGNGIDCAYFDPSTPTASPYTGDRAVLAFTGTMDYRPNIDAVNWFAREIFPRIRSENPKTEFAIVGANPTPDVMALSRHAGVRVVGRVDDVRPYIAHAHVVVAPLRLARGVQNKVLEGMAMAKPVVTTPQGLEGIDADPGRHVLVGESAEELARLVLTSLDPDIATRLGPAARQLMLERYSWDHQLSKLRSLIPA